MKLTRTKDGHIARLRYGKGRGRFLIRLRDESAAEKRADQLQDLAALLAENGKYAEAKPVLRKAAAVATDREFAEVARFAEGLCSGKISPNQTSTATIMSISQEWTSGKLHKRYPDQVKLKRTSDIDAQRFAKYINPVIGDRAVTAVTLDDCERVMAQLPTELTATTRRAIGQILARLLAMCVYPLRLIERSPIPPGFLPKRSQLKAMAYLYPDEDRRLMACTTIPVEYRLLWGWFIREGMREAEALGLQWCDLDLQRGAVRLEKNKTDDARSWALSPGVAAALETYKERCRADAKPNDLVFVDEQSIAHDALSLPETLRRHAQDRRAESAIRANSTICGSSICMATPTQLFGHPMT